MRCRDGRSCRAGKRAVGVVLGETCSGSFRRRERGGTCTQRSAATLSITGPTLVGVREPSGSENVRCAWCVRHDRADRVGRAGHSRRLADVSRRRDFVADQLASVLDDTRVEASKSGMLGSPGLVELVAEGRWRTSMGFYSLDPIMAATSCHRLVRPEVVRLVRDRLLPVADLITPNLPEAALLLGDDVAVARTISEMRSQARELTNRGPAGVLLTGGHGSISPVVVILATSTWQVTGSPHTRVDTANTHGTRCTLSAAVTADGWPTTLPLPRSSSGHADDGRFGCVGLCRPSVGLGGELAIQPHFRWCPRPGGPPGRQ